MEAVRRVAVLAAVLAGSGRMEWAQSTQKTTVAVHHDRQWKLVWSDEFNGPDGSMPDPHKWQIVNDGSGYGNNELESYSSRPENLHVEKGHLVITARKEEYTGPDGIQRSFTSGRLETVGRFEVQYGRIEARMKVPSGQGLWPAFWMLGSSFGKEGWPGCGEIDIMENIGAEPGKVHSTIHGPGYSGGDALTSGYSLPGKARFSDGFHRFALEWEPGVLRFYVDGRLFETMNRDNVPSYKKWVFDRPYYLLLDLAVGGNWPGKPDEKTVFPARLLVDYVRVYR